MDCKRVIFPLLTVYVVVVYVSYKYAEDMIITTDPIKTRITSIETVSAPQQRDKRDIVTENENDVTKSPPFFGFVYKSEHICMGSDPYILILIISGQDNRSRRDTIRSTWGGIARGKEWPQIGPFKDVRIIFVLGQGQNTSLNLAVQNEALNHNDIMIGGFDDTYRNLSNKTLMGLKWMKTFCPGAQYVMKTDDDSFLDVPKIINHVQDVKSKNTNWNSTIIGYYAGIEKPDRDNKSKSYVSETEYPGEWYPPHVKGCMYVIPGHLALNILNASQRIHFLSMEDVFITGVLAEPFNVNFSGIPPELYDKNVGDGSRMDVCSFIREGKIMAHNIHMYTARYIWKRMINPEICKEKHLI